MGSMYFILLLAFSLSAGEVQQLFEKGRCQEVVARLQPGWETQPQWQLFGRELAFCYLQDLRYEDAHRVFVKLQKRMPFSSFVERVGKGYLQLLFRAKHFEEGEHFLRKVEEGRKFSLAFLEMALKFEEAKGDYRQALHWVNLVERQGMIPPFFLEKKGDYYRYLGKEEEAILSYLGVLSRSQVVAASLRAKLESFPSKKVDALLRSYLQKHYSPALLRYAASRASDFSNFFQDIVLPLRLPIDEKLKAVVEVSREKGGRFSCDALDVLNRVYGERSPYRLTFQEYRRCHPSNGYRAFCRQSRNDLDRGRCAVLFGERAKAQKLLRKVVFENPEGDTSLPVLETLFALEEERESLAEALVWVQFGELQRALGVLLHDGSLEALSLALRIYVRAGDSKSAIALFQAYPDLKKKEDALYSYMEALRALRSPKWKAIALLYLQHFPEGKLVWKVREELELAP